VLSRAGPADGEHARRRQTHAQVWKSAGGSERARKIVASEFKHALEAPTLDAFDDGRQAGGAPDDAGAVAAGEGGGAAPDGARAPGGGGANGGPNGGPNGDGGADGGADGGRGGAAADDGGGLDLERALAGAPGACAGGMRVTKHLHVSGPCHKRLSRCCAARPAASLNEPCNSRTSCSCRASGLCVLCSAMIFFIHLRYSMPQTGL